MLLAHGAYLLPHIKRDMEAGDEVALWSPAIAPRLADRDRPIHVVGYPLAHVRDAQRQRPVSRRRPRILVLGQAWWPTTAMLDRRGLIRHYLVACHAIATGLPDADVTLRPHPADELATARCVVDRCRSLAIDVDPVTDIATLLAGSDLCIGALSTATLQAALTPTPVVL